MSYSGLFMILAWRDLIFSCFNPLMLGLVVFHMHFSDLQEQLEQLREQKDQYKAISVDLQKTVDEHSNVSTEYDINYFKSSVYKHHMKTLHFLFVIMC
jgi:hypothetical protein